MITSYFDDESRYEGSGSIVMTVTPVGNFSNFSGKFSLASGLGFTPSKIFGTPSSSQVKSTIVSSTSSMSTTQVVVGVSGIQNEAIGAAYGYILDAARIEGTVEACDSIVGF